MKAGSEGEETAMKAGLHFVTGISNIFARVVRVGSGGRVRSLDTLVWVPGRPLNGEARKQSDVWLVIRGRALPA